MWLSCLPHAAWCNAGALVAGPPLWPTAVLDAPSPWRPSFDGDAEHVAQVGLPELHRPALPARPPGTAADSRRARAPPTPPAPPRGRHLGIDRPAAPRLVDPPAYPPLPRRRGARPPSAASRAQGPLGPQPTAGKPAARVLWDADPTGPQSRASVRRPLLRPTTHALHEPIEGRHRVQERLRPLRDMREAPTVGSRRLVRRHRLRDPTTPAHRTCTTKACKTRWGYGPLHRRRRAPIGPQAGGVGHQYLIHGHATLHHAELELLHRSGVHSQREADRIPRELQLVRARPTLDEPEPSRRQGRRAGRVRRPGRRGPHPNGARRDGAGPNVTHLGRSASPCCRSPRHAPLPDRRLASARPLRLRRAPHRRKPVPAPAGVRPPGPVATVRCGARGSNQARGTAAQSHAPHASTSAMGTGPTPTPRQPLTELASARIAPLTAPPAVGRPSWLLPRTRLRPNARARAASPGGEAPAACAARGLRRPQLRPQLRPRRRGHGCPETAPGCRSVRGRPNASWPQGARAPPGRPTPHFKHAARSLKFSANPRRHRSLAHLGAPPVANDSRRCRANSLGARREFPQLLLEPRRPRRIVLAALSPCPSWRRSPAGSAASPQRGRRRGPKPSHPAAKGWGSRAPSGVIPPMAWVVRGLEPRWLRAHAPRATCRREPQGEGRERGPPPLKVAKPRSPCARRDGPHANERAADFVLTMGWTDHESPAECPLLVPPTRVRARRRQRNPPQASRLPASTDIAGGGLR